MLETPARACARAIPDALHRGRAGTRRRLSRGRSRPMRSTRSAWTTAKRSCRPWRTRWRRAARCGRPGPAAAHAGRLGLHAAARRAHGAGPRWRSPRAISSARPPRYHCLLFKPVWLVETARGCPFRCNFCSVWQLYGRSFRERSIGAVVEDFSPRSAPHVFVVDDLFWNHPERSLELARALSARGRAQALDPRADAHGPGVPPPGAAGGVAAARARTSTSSSGSRRPPTRSSAGVAKDARRLLEHRGGTHLPRTSGYGVTGNFLVDPDWDEDEFRELWDFVAQPRLPARGLHDPDAAAGDGALREDRALLEGQPWFKFDMHHVLWEPRLGASRFFELYAETWRRSILNVGGEKRWIDWMRQVRRPQIPYLTRVLLRTQRMMKASAYLEGARVLRAPPGGDAGRDRRGLLRGQLAMGRGPVSRDRSVASSISFAAASSSSISASPAAAEGAPFRAGPSAAGSPRRAADRSRGGRPLRHSPRARSGSVGRRPTPDG